MHTVLHEAAYPHADIKVEHQSLAVGTGAIIKIASKMLFKKNYRVGVMLTDSLNEFELASVLDTYMRTFPKSINSFSVDGRNITSMYGLTLYPTGDLNADRVNEVHVLDPKSFTTPEQNLFNNASIIKYNRNPKRYPIEICLERIAALYGTNFKNCVKLTLDYN
jgi:hypothetical protein